MSTGKTVLCQKDPGKKNVVDNYRPISYLPLMWKLMTEIISNVLYGFLENILISCQMNRKVAERKAEGQRTNFS